MVIVGLVAVMRNKSISLPKLPGSPLQQDDASPLGAPRMLCHRSHPLRG